MTIKVIFQVVIFPLTQHKHLIETHTKKHKSIQQNNFCGLWMQECKPGTLGVIRDNYPTNLLIVVEKIEYIKLDSKKTLSGLAERRPPRVPSFVWTSTPSSRTASRVLPEEMTLKGARTWVL